MEILKLVFEFVRDMILISSATRNQWIDWLFIILFVVALVLEKILTLATEYRWLRLLLIMLLVVAILGFGFFLMFGHRK